MALINCPECGKQVSEKAPTCPQCGSPIAPAKKEKKEAKQYGCGTLIVALVLLFIFISVVTPDKPKQAQKPKTAADLRKDKLGKCFSGWNGAHINLEKQVKASMNDPNSYEHDETRYSDKKDHLIVYMTFRGKNAFGGVVKNSVTAKTDMQCNVVEIIAQEP
jgi:hypothetical protein